MDAILSHRRRSVVLGLGGVALVGCGRSPTASSESYLQFGGSTMASGYTVRLKAHEQEGTQLRAAVQAALDDVDAHMSMFSPDSELSALNRAAAGNAVSLSEPLYDVLAEAERISRWSGGAFDITVAPLVERWGFGTRRVRAVPTAADLSADRRRVDWRSLALDAASHRVIKRASVVQADLGGIAAGYGADRAAAALDARGVVDYMVEVSGEVRARGLNAAGRPWRIGIEEPDAGHNGRAGSCRSRILHWPPRATTAITSPKAGSAIRTRSIRPAARRYATGSLRSPSRPRRRCRRTDWRPP